MALEEFQRLLLRVYTDQSLQSLEETPGYERLSPRERAALRGIPRKELARFQRALAGKRSTIMARKTETQPGRILCSEFSLQGPILSFNRGDGMRTVPLSRAGVQLAKHLALAGEPLAFSTLLRAYSEHGSVSLRAVIELALPLARYRLAGFPITCL